MIGNVEGSFIGFGVGESGVLVVGFDNFDNF